MPGTTISPVRPRTPATPGLSREGFYGLVFVFLIAMGVLFSRFLPGASLPSYFDDDFFYYALVAKNLALHGISTFDGTHLTNGYHPLWLLVLTGFFRLSTGAGFFYMVEAITLVSVCAVYVLSYRCLVERGARETWAAISSAVLSVLCLNLVKGGMEPTLTFPLLLLFLWYRLRPGFSWTMTQSALLGFIGSLVILSRLDTGIVIALLFIADAILSRVSPRTWVTRGCIYSAGAFLVPVYLYVNWSLFGTLMPVSGEAKELRLHHFLSAAPLLSLVHPFHPLKPGLALPIVFGLLAEGAIVVLLFRTRTRKPDTDVLAIGWSLLLFPIIHIALLSLLSDWQLWIWYFYPLVVSVFGAALLATELREAEALEPSVMVRRVAWTVLIVCVSGYTLALQAKLRRPNSNELVVTAHDISKFASTHPGIYAMGDRSGYPAWSIASPLIQLEGLVMDKQYLDYLRQGPQLIDLLRRYHVRYYIGTNLERDDGCYLATEPAQAGSDSIKTHSLLCANPVATFVHSSTETEIFDVNTIAKTAESTE